MSNTLSSFVHGRVLVRIVFRESGVSAQIKQIEKKSHIENFYLGLRHQLSRRRREELYSLLL